MPAEISYGDDFDAWPIHAQLAFDADRSWAADAPCTNPNGQLRYAWTVLANEVVTFGDSKYLGADLIALALQYCRACPVQWQCASFAIHTAPKPEQLWGTWGADMIELRWLKRRGHDVADELLEEAAADQVPVQEAIHDARSRATRERRVRRVPVVAA